MTGFEPRTSGIGSNHSTNWATTTSLVSYCCGKKTDFMLVTCMQLAEARIQKCLGVNQKMEDGTTNMQVNRKKLRTYQISTELFAKTIDLC